MSTTFPSPLNIVLLKRDLRTRDHFIQKFEVECEYEHTCINRGYESLLRKNDPELLEAWKEGRTGFPMVDACMRCLNATVRAESQRILRVHTRRKKTDSQP